MTRRVITILCVALGTVTGCRVLAAVEEEMHQGVAGVWLRNESAEVFVTGRPYPRVGAFRLRGSESPLRISVRDPFFGIRIWFLEPEQNEQSMLPALQPAVLERLGPLEVRLTAEPESKSGLQLVMNIRLDDHHPLLHLQHGFRNLRPEDRRIAVWSLMAFPHEGVGLVPWSIKKGAIRSCLYFPRTEADDPCLRLGQDALAVDFRRQARSGRLKVGVASDEGWAAYLWSGGLLHSSVDVVADGAYPEGGATVTFYSTGRLPGQGFTEVEHPGPLLPLKAGEMLWQEQTLRLLPPVDMTSEEPDDWCRAVEEAMQAIPW